MPSSDHPCRTMSQVDTLVKPIVKQVSRTSHTSAHFDLFVDVAKHPRLHLRSALLLLDVLGKICLGDPLFSRVAVLPFLHLVKRFHTSPLMQQYLRQFCQIALNKYVNPEASTADDDSALSAEEKKSAALVKHVMIQETLGKVCVLCFHRHVHVCVCVCARARVCVCVCDLSPSFSLAIPPPSNTAIHHAHALSLSARPCTLSDPPPSPPACGRRAPAVVHARGAGLRGRTHRGASHLGGDAGTVPTPTPHCGGCGVHRGHPRGREWGRVGRRRIREAAPQPTLERFSGRGRRASAAAVGKCQNKPIGQPACGRRRW